MSARHVLPTTGLIALWALLISVAVPAGPGGAARADSDDPNGPKCLCRYAGHRYALGEFACINSQLARCDMFLNNTSWTFLEDECVPAQNG